MVSSWLVKNPETAVPPCSLSSSPEKIQGMFNKIVIIGVGLMGGSIALGIKKRQLAQQIIGVDYDAKMLEAALGLGVIDNAKFHFADWLQAVDMIIVAVPARRTPEVLESIAPLLNPATLVMDIASFKDSIVATAERLRLRLVATHPMAGSEKSGVQYANDSLLENALWVITPSANNATEDIDIVQNFIENLGARAIHMPAPRHDALVALVSHLPYLLAVSLVELVADDNEKMLLAAGGFRDVTRVASGNPLMSRDMVVGNRAALKASLADFRAKLAQLEASLDDAEGMLEHAQHAKRSRDSLPIVRRSLLPQSHALTLLVADKPGQLAQITGALANADINIKKIEVLDIREMGGAIRLVLNSDEAMDSASHILSALGYEVRR